MITNSAWYRPSADTLDKHPAPGEAEQREATAAYLKWLAGKRGIDLPAQHEIEPSGIWTGQGRGRVCIVAMPGYGVSNNAVEVEELDDAGEVLRVSRLPLKSNATLPWNATKVREATGKTSVRATPLADVVRALTERLAHMEHRIAAMSAEQATVAPPEPSIGGVDEAIGEMAPWRGARDLAQMRADHASDQRQAERARRLRIVRAYLRMRAERNETRRLYDTERMIAADRMATIWRVQDARKAAIRMAVGMRHRRALDVAALEAGRSAYLDMERRALKAETRERGLMMEAERHVATIAALHAKPHHFGNEVRPDDLRRATQERDVARKALASAAEQRDRLAIAVDRGAAMLDEMTERAMRAEIALKAVEARRMREESPTPYRVNRTGVSFEVAA